MTAAPLRPGLGALRATQDRLAERRFLRSWGEHAAPWREVRGPAEARAAADALGYPVRLKVPLGGYDGRSQVRADGPAAIAAAVSSLGGDDGRPLLLEREIDFVAELSVVCARDRTGRTLAFPVARNRHDAGILAESVAPAPDPSDRRPRRRARSRTASPAASTWSACSRWSCSSSPRARG